MYNIIKIDGCFGVINDRFMRGNLFDISVVKYFDSKDEAEEYAGFMNFVEKKKYMPKMCLIFWRCII